MKILFNTDQIYLHGGIEKVMATKANYFAALPHTEVIIVTTEQQQRPPCYPLDSRIKLIDLGVDYNRSKSYFSKENIIKAVRHFKRQKKLFKELQSEVIISPNFNFDHYWLPFIKGKSKLIKERHSSHFLEEKQRKNASLPEKIRFGFSDFVEKKYDRIVVLNEDEKKYVKTGNATVIPNPVEPSPYTAALEAKQVIAAGRISGVKNFKDLITAWAEVTETFPDWQLHIYGQDYLNTKKKLENQIIQLQLQGKVVFKGSVSDIPKTMADYSLYVMSSETECFPMVLLEALSVGLPVVSYDCPNGPRNILTHGSDGLLTEYCNPHALALKIKELIIEPSLRQQMGVNGKNNVQRFFTDGVMAKWLQLLREFE